MGSRECFLWAGFGSVLPELIRLHGATLAAVQSGGPNPLDLPWWYFVVSFGATVGAGLFSVAWEPENKFKAIWIGISFPVIVSKLAQLSPTLPY